MGHFLLLPHGTSGSIYPFVWLGRQLQRHGHRATLVTADAYRETAASAGLGFAGVGNDELAALLADPQLWTQDEGARVSYARAAGSTRGFVDAIEAIVARDGLPDLMLAPMINFGARLVREKRGIPLISVHLYPMLFVSAHDLPLFAPVAHRLRRLPLWLRRALLLLPNPLDRSALPAVRTCCEAHGVEPPYSLWKQWWHSPDGVLALFPEWFAAPQPDWPHNMLQWDFPLEDMAAEQPLEPALRQFLAAGDKPVVFTAGTGQLHAESFFAEATELARQCGCRAVFLTRKLEQLPRALPETIFASAYAPFSALLPHARAFVHHGGIGTVSQSLAAGVPQLVVAMALDQPDNAERVERLGAGIATTADRFTAAHALPLLQRCLHDEAIRRASAACAERLRTRPATDALVAWVESRQVPSRRFAQAARAPAGDTPPVYLIPGLGADSRTYREPWDEVPGAVYVEWPEYHGEASIPAVARFVVDAWQIPDGAIVVAPSFAGAVACEIANIRALAAVVLVASSPDPADYVALARSRRLRPFIPEAWLQRFLRRREGIRRQRYGHTPTPFMLALLNGIEQFSVCQLSFHRDMYEAMVAWPGGIAPHARVLRIHGRHDSTVRPPATADLMLDGGHLVIMTHARECVDFVRSGLADGFEAMVRRRDAA
ncbi:MAG: hypothetical protein IT517_10065 [Burkholderiales bacterium]|nr:hypothetical protein [Burkholderiales bacterium]